MKFNGKFTIRLGFYVGFSWYSTLLEGVNSADQPLEMTCCHCWLCPRICCQIQGTPKIKKGKIHENRQKDNIFERIYWICIINVYIYRYTYIYIYDGWWKFKFCCLSSLFDSTSFMLILELPATGRTESCGAFRVWEMLHRCTSLCGSLGHVVLSS